MKKNFFSIGAVLFGLLLLIGAGCNNDTVKNSVDLGSSSTIQSGEDVKEINMIARNFSFNPKEIKVKQGEVVRVNFKVEQGFHDFVIDEFNVKTSQLSTGGQESVEFLANKKGTFEYYCSVGNHRQNGMVGKLIVE